MTAVDRGRSARTSMGYTPYEGPMMGTRSGSVDPGILLRLMHDGVSADELADGLAHRSGLLAIAGTSDAREIQRASEGGDERARLALAMFAGQASESIAAAATALPRLDAVVFTGGIGAHSATFRAAILAHLGPLGVTTATAEAEGDAILGSGSPAVVVVEAREDLVIGAEVDARLRKLDAPA